MSSSRGAKKHLAGAGYITINFDTPAAAYGDTLHEFWTKYEIFTGEEGRGQGLELLQLLLLILVEQYKEPPRTAKAVQRFKSELSTTNAHKSAWRAESRICRQIGIRPGVGLPPLPLQETT